MAQPRPRTALQSIARYINYFRQPVRRLHQTPRPGEPPQCLQKQRVEPLRKYPVSMQIRRLRYQAQTKKGWIARAWRGYILLYKENPVSMTVITFVMIPWCIFLIWFVHWWYWVYIVGAFQAYPEPVAKELRKALYFTNRSLDPKRAQKYYIRAQKIAIEQEHMDPFGEEVAGIRIMYGVLFEKCKHFQKAIEVYETIYGQNLQWLEKVGIREGWEGRRNRLLKTTIQIAHKLGELYANPYVMERDLAEEKITWAVETDMKEMARRAKDGVAEGEGGWLPPEEQGASLERLAQIWEEKDLHQLAAPLFLRALVLCPKNNCHAAVLMNNLSSSLAQQRPPVTPTATPEANRMTLISNARQWAEKAIATAARITGEDRNEECETALAVATHNLGELSEMEEDFESAREKYEEARILAKKLSFKEGIKNVDKALKRMNQAEKARGKEQRKRGTGIDHEEDVPSAVNNGK